MALTSAELDHVLAGNTLSFDAHLPDGVHESYLMRDDATPVEPAPRFRLRVPEGVFTAVRQGHDVTPLFTDVPFTLDLAPHGKSAKPAKPDKRDEESRDAAVYGNLFAGLFMVVMGAIRAGLSPHPTTTNTAMMVIGGGVAIYGAFRWLTLPKSGGNGPGRA